MRTCTEGLSEKYMRRVSGFPLPYRLSRIVRELQFEIPEHITTLRATISPWLIPSVDARMLLTTDKRQLTEADIRARFCKMISEFPGYRLFYTDGSKQNGSTGCAFTVNNAFFSHKLHPCFSVFTAELFAIREALQYIRTNRVERSLICSDSQSAIRAISTQKRDHCILIEIAEVLYQLACDDIVCSFLWIPGHSGIAGNVRADHWARMAHAKPSVTHAHVGYREFFPQIRECIARHFTNIWHDYRPTLLKAIKPDIAFWTSSVRSNRKEEILLSRMRLGHTLITHAHVIDRLPPPTCDSCRCQLNVRHILLDCQRFARQRRAVRAACQASNMPMNIATLLGDCNSVIIDAVFRFLKECGLYNRF